MRDAFSERMGAAKNTTGMGRYGNPPRRTMEPVRPYLHYALRMRRYPRFFLRWRARARARAHKGSVQVVPANGRNLLVYAPASYARGDARYPVIYMQDGQNLFDPATSFAGDWGLKTALAWASRRGFQAIVVGIPNMGAARITEYTPFVDPKVGGGQGERYLDYLVHTVKPLIDERFRTLPERAHTGIAGSSLGGLISLYAFFRYPEVFGFTAALSRSLCSPQRWAASPSGPIAGCTGGVCSANTSTAAGSSSTACITCTRKAGTRPTTFILVVARGAICNTTGICVTRSSRSASRRIRHNFSLRPGRVSAPTTPSVSGSAIRTA